MEIPIIASLIILGYIFKNKKHPKSQKYKENKLQQKSVYNNNRYNQVDKQVRKIKEDFYNKSKNPLKSGIIPENFNQKILNSKTSNSNQIKSQLSGEVMVKENFTHNNMVPFFGSKLTQNMNLDNNISQRKLEMFTGTDEYTSGVGKKEQKPLFKPTMNTGGYINGKPVDMDRQLNRYDNGNKKPTELPFEQIRVGPGLNQGYTDKPSGGFQQLDKRDYLIPKSIDELRTKNNPKLQYRKPVIFGKNGVDRRTDQGEVYKHRPDKFYINSQDRYFVTTGKDLKSTQRPTILVKDTNRQSTTTDYYGIARGDDNVIDYGLSSMEAPTTERELTGVRTHIMNATKYVKALIAPLLDVMKPSRKEYCEANNYLSNFATNVSKLQVYDPNDIAKITIKETTSENNNQVGYFGNKLKSIVYDPDDIPQTTKKDMTQDDNHFGPAKTVIMTAPKSQADMMNVNLNEVREGTLKLREPTKCNVSLTNGGDVMNIDIQKLEKDRENQRKMFGNKVYGQIKTIHENQITKNKSQLDNKSFANRIDSVMVKAHTENPFTHPLNSI